MMPWTLAGITQKTRSWKAGCHLGLSLSPPLSFSFSLPPSKYITEFVSPHTLSIWVVWACSQYKSLNVVIFLTRKWESGSKKKYAHKQKPEDASSLNMLAQSDTVLTLPYSVDQRRVHTDSRGKKTDPMYQ